MPPDSFAQLEEATRTAHEQHFNELLAPLGMSTADPNVHLLRGDPGVLIPQLTVYDKTDLILMGTVARTGIAGLLMGNTAEKILQNVSCSVLALKPSSFIDGENLT
jgi:universal stress protein E